LRTGRRANRKPSAVQPCLFHAITTARFSLEVACALHVVVHGKHQTSCADETARKSHASEELLKAVASLSGDRTEAADGRSTKALDSCAKDRHCLSEGLVEKVEPKLR